jgi:hypothetical protein
MISFFFWFAIGLAAGGVAGSFFEWMLHRFVMHKAVRCFRYPYERHALVHHLIFKGDETYHLVHEADKKTIPMAWWNGPALVAVGMIPFVIASFFMRRWGLLCGAAVACAAYYAAYEYIHWCMHLPGKRRLERSALFRRLNGHHVLHHRYMHKNFNVVLPLADLLLGTLRLRAKFAFKQPNGPAVPDVQPKKRNWKTHAFTGLTVPSPGSRVQSRLNSK